MSKIIYPTYHRHLPEEYTKPAPIAVTARETPIMTVEDLKI